MLNFYDFIQVFVFTRNHHLKVVISGKYKNLYFIFCLNLTLFYSTLPCNKDISRLPGNFPILHRFIKRMTDLHLVITDRSLSSVTLPKSWNDVSIKHYTITLMSISFSLPFSLDLSKEIRRHFSYFIHIIASVRRWTMVRKCGWYFAI